MKIKDDSDPMLPASERYVRRVVEYLSSDSTDRCSESGPEYITSAQNVLQIVVCMKPDASERLLNAQYLQGDVAFKRVVNYKEFELGCLDRKSNTSKNFFPTYCETKMANQILGLVFCRVFLTQETAEAHQRVFELINDIVKEDTGRNLKWYHIHAENPTDYNGYVLQFTGDQHGGQAKGKCYLNSST